MMRVILTEDEIELIENDEGLFDYFILKTKVEGFRSKIEALNHAEEKITEFIERKYLNNG